MCFVIANTVFSENVSIEMRVTQNVQASLN